MDDDEDGDLDEAGGAEREHAEQEIVDRATAAQTIPELEAELLVLRDLEKIADRLRKSGQDAKWRQLSEMLHKPPMVNEATGERCKLLIFSEPRARKAAVLVLTRRVAVQQTAGRLLDTSSTRASRVGRMSRPSASRS